MNTKNYFFLSVLLSIMFLFPTLLSAVESENTYVEAISNTVDYYRNNDTTLNNWQQMVGLSEAGENIAQDPWELPDWNLDELTENSSVLDYTGKIMSLLAAGENPKSMAGRDLVNELAQRQLLNGSFGDQTYLTYWSILALDEAEGTYDVDGAVNYLVSQQNDYGGFSWVNKDTAPDVDSTGIALLALANQKSIAGVDAAIEKAVDYLKGEQKLTGGFGVNSISLENCESTALAILGLVSCAEDITSDEWKQSGSNMIDALLSFQLTDGSFCHLAGTTSNALATRQALMALAAVVNADIGGSGGSGGSGGGNTPNESTVRVRVEGHSASLADETVTISGTALDALKEAVGENQVELLNGFINEIKGEGGQTGIAAGINTNWMYYVIRDGAIEPGAFDLGAGSYNVEDGDEIIFYIGAMDAAWAPKTYLPQVSISPSNVKERQTLTISISAKKYVWPDGLNDLSGEGITAIGDYTVLVGEESYTSFYGQVTIPNVPEGTVSYTVYNESTHGYPDVVIYKGSFLVGPAVDKTVRVRVEGHTASLADETVTVSGTALDALKEAVGEENVIAPGGWITQIKGESGSAGIVEGINTDWMYYVIRDGVIEPEAFNLGAGSYNVEDGDEIIFYIGAVDATWAPKTYLPQVSISPSNVKAGQTVTMSISAKKNDWSEGLIDLSGEETTAISSYTLLVGETVYTSSLGQVNIPSVSEGTVSYTVYNESTHGYADVVTFKGSFHVESNSGPPSNADKISVKIAVVGEDGELLFGPRSVKLSEDGQYGWTALGALDATRLDWEFSEDDDGFVIEIAEQRNQGQNGWMFKVNSEVPTDLAEETSVESGDKIIWWYSMEAMSEGPDWDDLLSGSPSGGTSTATDEEVTKSTIKGYKDNLTGIKQNTLLNKNNKMTNQAAKNLKEELTENSVSLNINAGQDEYFMADNEVSLLIPEKSLDQATNITVKEVSSSQQPKQFAIKLGSSVYEFGPSGTIFDHPVTMAIKVPLTEDIDVSKLSPAWYNEETKTWVTIPAVIDLETGLVVFQIDHFTKFAVIQYPDRKTFPDVGENMAWAKDAVEILAGRGFISGTGTGFEPKRSITRAEFVKIIVTALELKTKVYQEGLFPDVKIDDWHAGYVMTAYQEKIITGDQDGKFRPGDSISRNEVAAVLYRLQEAVPAGALNTSLTFKDTDKIPAWAVTGIKYANQQGLMTGYEDGIFKGSNSLTRAEAAVTIYRYLGLIQIT